MSEKVRHVDLHPDEFLAAVAGEMSPAELGVYWMVCMLCYTRGGSIPDDVNWLRAKFRPNPGNRVIGDLLEGLIKSGKICREGHELSVSRVRAELEHAMSRIRASRENGRKGGRPQRVTEPKPSYARVTTNHQPPDMSPNGDNAREPRSSLKQEFAEWWLTYPNKVGKHAAELKFATARKTALLGDLLEGVTRYKQTKPDDRPWLNPATWLFQQRWLDQPAGLELNGHGGATGPPRTPLNPRMLGHSLPCSCNNCTRWAALHPTPKEA